MITRELRQSSTEPAGVGSFSQYRCDKIVICDQWEKGTGSGSKSKGTTRTCHIELGISGREQVRVRMELLART